MKPGHAGLRLFSASPSIPRDADRELMTEAARPASLAEFEAIEQAELEAALP
jgi:hypothetical protein